MSGMYTRDCHKFCASIIDHLGEAIRSLWGDCCAFHKQLPFHIIRQDAIDGFQHGLLIVQAGPDYV